MKRNRKKRRNLLGIFRDNDIILRIYLSFVFVLALTAILIGTIFLQLYQKNYLQSYTATLTQKSHLVAKKVRRYSMNNQVESFEKFSSILDQLEQTEGTDVWIVSNTKSKNGLKEEFTNANTDALSEDLDSIFEKAFQGKTNSSSSFDSVYGMVILRVATPIYTDKTKTKVSGAVMMVSMLDRQSMGIKEGKYLITLSALLGVLVAYVVAVLFSKYLSRPLEKIDRDIMKLSTGDYSPIETRHRNTQLGRLEIALDDLAGRLKKIVQERQELDRVRQDFFANVSHELRTPITVMRGYTESLSDGVIEEEEAKQECYDRMAEECRGMERLVGDLFVLSKMQNPDFEIEKEPVSLMEIFEDVMRNGNVIGKEKNVTVSVSLPENDPCLMLGDYDRLRQMFLIIVDNAVKFSKENGSIEVRVNKESGKLKVAIQDYGVGISKEQLPYIFEKFYKSKLKQNEKGTGLGLMIAKQIALRHDGTISVESEPGHGTTFFFSFEECTCIDEYE